MPTEPSWLHPEAIKEARAARERYLERSAEVADAFMAELDAAIERIEQGPSRWPPYLGGTRRIYSTDSRSSWSSERRLSESKSWL